jgi:hypothetical protein
MGGIGTIQQKITAAVSVKLNLPVQSTSLSP